MPSNVSRFKPAVVMGSFFCGLLVGTAVLYGSSARGDRDRCTPPSSTPFQAAHLFDPSQQQVGDRFFGLSVTEMKVSCFNDKYVGTVNFQGEIEVSGVYEPQAEVAGGIGACFYVVRQSESKLPRLLGDERNPWFCFRDPEQAREKFGDRDRDFLAKIIIDNYQIVLEPKGVTNGATLIGVIDTIPLDSP